MNLLPKYNLAWLEDHMTFGFSSKKSAPPPAAPKKSEAEVKADANRDRSLREEQYVEKKATTAGKRRRMAEILQQSILGETSFVSKVDGAKINKQERAKHLTVGQFQSFLEQIEIHAAEYGVRLPSEQEIDVDS